LSKSHILLVDDEHDILDLIEYNLIKQGYSVTKADSGSSALAFAREHHPDLILLDIMMPGMDGYEVCSHLKQDPSLKNIPVIFLTARSDETSEVRGLDLGGDDYVTKPISISKLLSRIKALLRRSRGAVEKSEEPIVIHGLEIDREQYVVIKNGNEIRLPRKEFEVLYFLARHKGKVVTRQVLLDEIWGNNIYVVDRTVDVHIRKIREKIGDDMIETIKGVGYRFRK